MKKIFLVLIGILILIIGATSVAAISISTEFGDPSFEETGSSVTETPDGGFMAVGGKMVDTSNRDIWVLKVDANLNEQWSKTYGADGYDNGYSIKLTSDQGYIIAGDTRLASNNYHGGAWLVKTDSNGNKLWDLVIELWNGSSYTQSVFNSVEETYDGGYIAAGSASTYQAQRGYLVKTDASGNVLWSNTYSGNIVTGSQFSSVRETSDNGYIAVGAQYDFPNKVFLVKTDASGNELWHKLMIDGIRGAEIQIAADGGYIIAGHVKETGGTAQDAIVIKTDTSGNLEWSKTFGEIGSYEYGWAIDITSDGGYVLGAKSSDKYGWIIKLDSEGNIVDEKKLATPDFSLAEVHQTSSGDYIGVGSRYYYTGIKYDRQLGLERFDLADITPSHPCTDADSTNDKYIAGTATGWWQEFYPGPYVMTTKEDTCYQSVNGDWYTTEWFCNYLNEPYPGEGYLASTSQPAGQGCPDGCVNGACVVGPTPITSCQAITTPGDYVLTQDISGSSGVCISISAPDVVLDCDGYKVSTDYSEVGTITANSDAHNAVIKNCVIENSDSGIMVRGKNSLVQNNVLTENYLFGIWSLGNDTTITENTISGGQKGIIITGRNNILTENYGCDTGENDIYVYLQGPSPWAPSATGIGNTCTTPFNYHDTGFTGCQYQCVVYDPVTGLAEIDDACPVIGGVYVGDDPQGYLSCVGDVLDELKDAAGTGAAFKDLYGHPIGYYRSAAAKSDAHTPTGAAVTDVGNSPNAITIALIALIVAVVALIQKKKN